MILFHLRRSAGAWIFLPLVVTGLFVAYSALDGGPQMWPISASAVGMSVQLLGPLAAGAAAYAGARAARQRTLSWERLSAIGQSRVSGAELAALLCWVISAFAVVILGVYVPTALVATWSGPPVIRTGADVLGLMMVVCAAFVVGRLCTQRLVPLAAAAITFAGTAVLRPVPALRLFSPADLYLYDQFNGPSTQAAAAQVLWFGGLAGTVVLAWMVRCTISRSAVLGLGLAIVTATIGAALLVGQNGRVYGPQVLDVWECTGADPQICVHPADQRAAVAVHEQVEAVAQRLRGTPFALLRVEQRPRGVGATPGPGAVGFALDDLRPASIAAVSGDVAANALGQTIDNCLGADNVISDGFPFAQVVAATVARGSAVPVPGAPPAVQQAAAEFGALDDSARRIWLTRHAEKLRSCSLAAADFT